MRDEDDDDEGFKCVFTTMHSFTCSHLVSSVPRPQTRAIGGGQEKGFTFRPMGRPHCRRLAGGKKRQMVILHCCFNPLSL